MTDSDFLRKHGLEDVAKAAEGLEPQFRIAQIAAAVQEALMQVLKPTPDEQMAAALTILLSLDKEHFLAFAMETLHDYYHQDHDCRAGQEAPTLEEMQVLMMAFMERLI